jgi:DNA-directed RNA polymerase specialized sigma24 family protein
VSPPADDFDPVLLPLMSATTEGEELEAALRAVLGSAAPLVEQLVTAAVERGVLPPRDAADLTHEAMLRLLVKLRQLVSGPDSRPITRLEDYLATLFRHTVDDYRRRTNPARAKLTHRVRYVLTHTRSLAVWGHDAICCGLAGWTGRTDVRRPPEVAPLRPVAPVSSRALRRMVEDVIRRAGGPVHLTDLVSTLADALGVASESSFWAGATPPQTPPPDEILQGREYLTLLWQEIEELPTLQRRALLLGLRTVEGESVARTFVTLRIASIRRIAATLEMPLERLLELWNQLPLPDLKIGPMLGRTRQQVINLRKSARERLSRRMGHALGSLRGGS